MTRTFASLRGELTRRTTITKLLKAKTISFFPGVCLLINGMTGPGVPFTSATFQESGWFFPTILFFAFALVSALSVLFIIEAMQAVPGNKHFQGTVEFATLINFYFGNVAHYVGQFLLYGALQSNAMQCIVLMAQTLDNILIDVFGKTCALAIGGPNAGWYCVAEISDDFPSPFGNTFILFSCGLLLVAILSVPLGIVNLDDNIIAQVIAFWLSVAIGVQWIGASFYQGLKPAKVPAFGTSFTTVVGTIMLNLAFTTVVPSWVNIKKRDVNTQGVVWSAVGIAVAFYMLVGLFPALGFNLDASGSILPALMRTGKLNKATAYMFSIVMLLPSIPVNFIVAQNNLVQNKVAGKRIGIFLAHVLPWFLCIPLQTGQTMQAFISWTSLIFVSTANFIIPILIYIKCLRFRREYNESRALTQKQKMLLKEIHWSSRTIHRFIDDAIARESGLAEYTKRHPGALVRDRSDLSLRGAVPPLEDDDMAQVIVPDRPQTPLIIIPPSIGEHAHDREKSNSYFPPPSPTGSILKNPMDSRRVGGGALDVPGDLSGRLIKLKKPSMVRFGSGEADDAAIETGAGDLSAGSSRRASDASGIPAGMTPPSVQIHPPPREDDVGPITISAAAAAPQDEDDDEEYLLDDVPDPDLEHKMHQKDLRRQSSVWDMEQGISPGSGSSNNVKETLRRAMQTVRRGTSQSVMGLGNNSNDRPQTSSNQRTRSGASLGFSPQHHYGIRLEPLNDSRADFESDTMASRSHDRLYPASGGEDETEHPHESEEDEDDDHAHQQPRDASFADDGLAAPSSSSAAIPRRPTRLRRQATGSTSDSAGGGDGADLLNKRPMRATPSPTPSSSPRRSPAIQAPLASSPSTRRNPITTAATRNRTTAAPSGAATPRAAPRLWRKQTLPVHPDYISPTFRSIPTWFPVRGRIVAWALLAVTIGVTLGNFVIALKPSS
ncbi:hypothetical protein HDU87_003487 [Geranomyces variabilis]|uniref:Amino acid transporter transmembrane domain-containing protein n=1 Tax=Geranomyces variabilis TaxID=109894 RepID=A0AAD5XN55_9FUNG|nr:hypothetical protein HDU87_003487 [Geranomyces variabilis]